MEGNTYSELTTHHAAIRPAMTPLAPSAPDPNELVKTLAKREKNDENAPHDI